MSSPEAPKQTQKPTQEDNRAIEAAAAIETIEPSTGEIIVLARHKPATKEGTMAKAAAAEQVTPLGKPERRKTAKERANAKLKTKPAEDETTPDTTATAQSDAVAKAGAGSGAKSAEVLAANEARKARKAAEKAKAKARTGAGPRANAKAGKGAAKKKAGGR